MLNPSLALLLGLAATLNLSCNKKEVKAGDPCEKQGEIQCVDKKNGAFCTNGKWEVMACEGPTGCMSVAGSGSCTHHEYAVGEPCFDEGKPECSGDKKTMLKCENAHWKALNECKGALGCVANAEGAKCDLGASAPGDACTKENEGNGSCTEDGKALLLCKNEKMVVAAQCGGRHGCRQRGTELVCDETVAALGDACDSSEYEGKFACTPDQKTRLVCKSGKMIKDRDCKCSVLIDQVNCN
jgi:hypothetical protein